MTSHFKGSFAYSRVRHFGSGEKSLQRPNIGGKSGSIRPEISSLRNPDYSEDITHSNGPQYVQLFLILTTFEGYEMTQSLHPFIVSNKNDADRLCVMCMSIFYVNKMITTKCDIFEGQIYRKLIYLQYLRFHKENMYRKLSLQVHKIGRNYLWLHNLCVLRRCQLQPDYYRMIKKKTHSYLINSYACGFISFGIQATEGHTFNVHCLKVIECRQPHFVPSQPCELL